MKFSVIRNGNVIAEIETKRKSKTQFEPVENITLLKDDILVSTDGTKLRVLAYNPDGFIRSGISFEPLSDE